MRTEYGSYRKDHQNIWLAFYNHCQIEADLEPLESLMNDNVLNLCC
jgi:hypothetical protein